MTIEEMHKEVDKYCDTIGKFTCTGCRLRDINNHCRWDYKGDTNTEDCYWFLVNEGLIGAPWWPEVNFVKADPDDEVSGLADSGTRREFDSGAVRDMAEGKGRCDLLPAVAILRLAKHFERGAVKYSDRNWEKGIPIHSFIDSAIRHTMKYLDGQHDEDHLCAAAWNLICAMWTEEKHPELNDLPWAKGDI